MDIDNNHVTKLGELKSLVDGLWDKIKSAISTATSGLLSKTDADEYYQTKGSYATVNQLNSLGNGVYGEINGINSKIPSTASSENKMATTADIPDVSGFETSEHASSTYATKTEIPTNEIFWCTQSTTFSEITSAINDGKFVVVKYRYTPAEGVVLDYTIPIVDGDVKTNKYTFSRIIDSTGKKVCAEITSDDEWDFTHGGSWGINITGNAATASNAATADNASGRKFTAQSEGEEAFLKASNGTQSVVLDVLGDGSKRGIYCNASGTAPSGLWPILVDINNNVSLNGTATYANKAKTLDVSDKIGSSSNPVFIGANGVPAKCGFSIVIGSTGTNTSTLYFV